MKAKIKEMNKNKSLPELEPLPGNKVPKLRLGAPQKKRKKELKKEIQSFDYTLSFRHIPNINFRKQTARYQNYRNNIKSFDLEKRYLENRI
jgi:hypothetical protein